MTTVLTLRDVKGSPLTHAEVDGNFTALRETADRADWSFAQTRWMATDFVAAATTTGVWPYGWTAQSSGTLAAFVAGGPTFGVVSIRSSTTAGGGGQLVTAGGIHANTGYAFRGVFRTRGIATATTRIGLSNAFGTALANNFAFLEVVGDTGTFYVRRSLGGGDPQFVDPTPFTLTANTDYVVDIDWLSSTEIRFVCWELTTGAVLRNWTVTIGSWPNPAWSSMGAGCRATESTTAAATDLLIVDYMGFGPSRPGSLIVPV
jgi:hypothetical protein